MARSEALDYLFGLPQYGNVADDARKPGLERMEQLMREMGHPHESFPAVHVAGTNGKGSVSAMIAAIATEAGLKTGLHTSPHLTHVEQRMRVDGAPAPRDWLVNAIDRHRTLFDRVEPSFFELTVALTFLYFAEQQVDLAVIEVGLGGRLDATNVLRPDLAIITNIDLDHTDLLGTTLGEIAREKADIITSGAPVLSGVTQDEARSVLSDVAEQRSAPLEELGTHIRWTATSTDLFGSMIDVDTPNRRYDQLHVSLPGLHQQANAALATRAAEHTIEAVRNDPTPVYEGLANVRNRTGFRGRLDVIQEEPLMIVDVAHNPSGIEAGLKTIDPVRAERDGQLYLCFNAVQGKRLPDVAQLFAERDAYVIPIPIDTKRALPPDEIAETLRAHGVTVLEPRSIEAAVTDLQDAAQPEDLVLLTGSHKMFEILPDSFSGRV